MVGKADAAEPLGTAGPRPVKLLLPEPHWFSVGMHKHHGAGNQLKGQI